MAAMRGPRLQVGSATWVTEERASALHMVESDVEEFSYSVRNEFDWLNEHMAGVFNENETNIAETFKTPGKLRGKTPRTARKVNNTESRVPLSDVFGTTPQSSANRLAQQLHNTKAQSPRLQKGSPATSKLFSPRLHMQAQKPVQSQPATQDSGYYGSQDVNPMNDQVNDMELSAFDASVHEAVEASPNKLPAKSTAIDSRTAATNEEPTTHMDVDDAAPGDDELHEDASSPVRSVRDVEDASTPQPQALVNDSAPSKSAQPQETSPGDSHSASDTSSPIRPVVRKSSLNFASLPAREPLTAGKSMGARMSRTSHLDLNRTSYYSRPTGGKSIGNHNKHDDSGDEEHDDEDAHQDVVQHDQESAQTEDVAVKHNKTYTQRLQDQISMLGKSQPNGSRPSKSIHGLSALQGTVTASQSTQEPKSPSPRKHGTTTTPGAFPEDDEDDDWIDPPADATNNDNTISRPPLAKSHSADVMEGLHDQLLSSPKHAQNPSPSKPHNSIPERPSVLGHGKSASVSVVPTLGGSPLKNATSMSVLTTCEPAGSPPKSPSRSIRDSPLKQVRSKFTSILKSSKNLLASSAAASAEGKSSILSPSTTRLGIFHAPSTESVVTLSNHEARAVQAVSPVAERDPSPSPPMPRRTRASAEAEKEEKRREKEAKLQAEQMEKLEKAREQEREKARVFSKEQDKIVAMEKQLTKDADKTAPKETAKPTRSSPRKAKPQETASKSNDQEDVKMTDAFPVPPPSASRPTQPARKDLKRPVKPGKDAAQPKAKQAFTVMTGSQHSLYPGSSAMSTTNQDNLGSSTTQPPSASRASKASLQPKPSAQSLKSSVSSATGRNKASELAAKKKEQSEREAQRQREAKAEMERKRAALLEEQKKMEQQRRQEAERQKQKQREEAEAKKLAQRQALERAKQTRAPPPAARPQPNGPPEYKSTQEKMNSSQRSDRPSNRPPSRMTSGMTRPQEDGARPVNAVLSTASKAASKRPLGYDGHDEGQGQARPAPARGGPQYQAKDAKRRRTSDEFASEMETENPPNIKGPPVRPSGGFKKDLQGKSLFQNGYSNAPQSATRDLFKATVSAQAAGQVKASHPLDMAQISKGGIPFAPNAAGGASAYKTPARPGAVHGPKSTVKSTAKSVPKSSPRFQNGDAIDLPEIQTDDEDDEDDGGHGMNTAPWADSPDLRRALMRQETMDPSLIFGPPAPLNMEEVFSKSSKERFHKFRARTSSANWSGADRLTEDDIRKDLAARDKMRRDGGWSYEMSKDMI